MSCTCPRCEACKGNCTTNAQTAARYASYCKKCARAWLCLRCNTNAVSHTKAERYCDTCLTERAAWCGCFGCRHLGGPHDGQCSNSKQNAATYAGYCKTCAKQWHCPRCRRILAGCPVGDLLQACRDCVPAPAVRCACLACPHHADDPCTTLMHPSEGRYCAICAPSWQCECVLQSCRHHRHASRCSFHIDWNGHRLLSPTVHKNVCFKCSPQYCTCVTPACPSHQGRSCARRRQHEQKSLCISCSRGGVLVCGCSGCAACSGTPCETVADFTTTLAGQCSFCCPCAGQAFRSFVHRRSLDLCIVPTAHDDLLKNLMSTETSLSTFTGDRASRTRALHTAFRGHILAAIAAPFPAVLRAVPQHILLRASPAHDWTLRSFRQTFYDHCLRDLYDSFTLFAEFTAADLRHIGSTLSLPYAGVWSHCHGDVASFLPVSGDLPHFPADVPVRLRPTYWTWMHDGGNRDLLLSSLDGVLQSVVFSLYGIAGLSSQLSWVAALTACMRVCCDDDVGRVSFLHTWTSFLEAPESDWSQRPPTLARPRFLGDYQLLGSHLGLHYLGVRSEVALFVVTLFHLRCYHLALSSQM